jgi:hypothetical protein
MHWQRLVLSTGPIYFYHKATTVLKDPTHAVTVEVVPLSCNYQLILLSYDAVILFVYQKNVAFGTARGMAYQAELKNK